MRVINKFFLLFCFFCPGVSDAGMLDIFDQAADPMQSPEYLNQQGVERYYGEILPINEEDTSKYWRSAIERGDNDAMCNMALLCFDDADDAAKVNQGLKLLYHAAMNGYIRAWHDLGDFYNLYSQVPWQAENALHFYTIAANNGYMESMLALGRFYMSCAMENGYLENYAAAIYFYETAARYFDNEEAAYQLGNLYLRQTLLQLEYWPAEPFWMAQMRICFNAENTWNFDVFTHLKHRFNSGSLKENLTSDVAAE